MIGYGDTHIGQRRSINQDYIFYSDTPVGNLPNLYLVADGMGGHKAGDKASSYAANAFVEKIHSGEKEQPLLLMKEAIESVNEELYALSSSRPEYKGMGTTFVAATVTEEEMYVMNIGDSRLYVLGERLRQITYDHSLVEELVRSGQLTREEARNHPQKNVITRALGVEEHVNADFFEVEKENFDMILLCSDGLTNMVTEETIEYVLRNAKDMKKAAEVLIGLANDSGGLDNISVVMAKKEER